MFDQDLSEARGFQDAGPQSGIGLIHEVINRELHEGVICCLLTHTIASLENEMPTWRTLAQENELDLFQFLPLAKIRLSDGESPLLFADGIKKSLLNLYCEKWKRAAIQVINNSTEKATSHVMNVDVYDFDHMIFQISMEEGIWELDTLVRLFQIFHRDEIRKLVLDPRITAEFSALIKASRPISAVKIDDKLNHVMAQIKPIRRKELYQDASLVQYTPIDVGDLFFSSNNQMTYILLGQPCDLMVRSVGKRAGKRASDHLLVPLVPLHRISPEDFNNKQANHWKTHSSMHYFYPDSNDIAEVVFSEANWVDVNFLDLSILNPDGLCRLDLANLPSIPEICTLGWRIRLEELIHRFTEEYNELNMIQKHVNRIRNPETKNLIQQALLSSHAFSKGIFDFKLQRISRYRQPAADRLLKMYTQYLSRDADEVDFAKSSQKIRP
jgi:hypothetical protein